ncbi:hypothetical protein Fmac_016524 [Flemingia macrophylla]|uniref:glucan endo-1,3-beta-D-glucosidase n=1 Tax=Flemingia macrophylla TaxID=520843 RepID=A0ABD1MHV6_9FABA
MKTYQNHTPYIFPEVHSTVLPDLSNFFSPHLLSSPLPTNSFFQNFTLNNGDQPEYIHPYLIKSSNSSLSLSYPSRKVSSSEISQVFIADLTITSKRASSGKHAILSYSDLSVTLDILSISMSFFLVRGSPYLTFSVTRPSLLSITTIHAIHSLSPNDSHTKFTLKFNNGQTWLIYASSTIHLSNTFSEINSNAFTGIIRVALLPESDSKHETVLDKFSLCYPVSGKAVFREPFCVEYHWETNVVGDLLMLTHPLHLQLLCKEDNDLNHVTVLDDFKYRSIDGDLVGVLIARASRLALIAEEVCFLDVISKVRKYLKETIESWLEGTFDGNGFLYDKKWGGIMIEQGSNNAQVDDGFAYGDASLVALGPTLTSLKILATKMWWHVEEGGDMYEKEFGKGNRILGVLWSNKRDTGLWFPYAECREFRLGIQVLPLVPILFSNVEYVKELVEWSLPSFNRHNVGDKWKSFVYAALNKNNVGDKWKGFVYALEGIYDNESALRKVKKLKDFHEGNSLTNLLWWLHSRGH